jgi:Immunity protein 35
MMTLNKAKQLALESLANATALPSDDLLIIDELTQCRRTGWIFFYESRAYLETGDVARALGATGPVVVTHKGEVHHLRGGQPAEDAIRAFEKTQRRSMMR